MTKAKAGGEQPVEIPDTLPILPLRNSVLFPGAIIPIDVGRRKSVRLVEDAIAKNGGATLHRAILGCTHFPLVEALVRLP